jgi:hypothetical protein
MYCITSLPQFSIWTSTFEFVLPPSRMRREWRRLFGKTPLTICKMPSGNIFPGGTKGIIPRLWRISANRPVYTELKSRVIGKFPQRGHGPGKLPTTPFSSRFRCLRSDQFTTVSGVALLPTAILGGAVAITSNTWLKQAISKCIRGAG